MTNQTDQVTIDPEVQYLWDAAYEHGDSGQIFGEWPEEIAKRISRRLAQPAPPVPGVSEVAIHKILNRYITQLQDIDDATDAVMAAIALAQTGEGQE